MYAKFHHDIPLSSRDSAIITFSEFGARPMINVILQFLELDLVNINVSAKFYQNILNGLRVKFHCFQNLKLGKTSTNINVYAKFHHDIPLSSRDITIITFFSEFGVRQSLNQ